MALQHTSEGHTGQHGYSRESAEPFAIQILRATFLAYPVAEQARVKRDVIERLRAEAQRGQKQPSALSRLASRVYGITSKDL